MSVRLYYIERDTHRCLTRMREITMSATTAHVNQAVIMPFISVLFEALELKIFTYLDFCYSDVLGHFHGCLPNNNKTEY
jgi:hypothetical protein